MKFVTWLFGGFQHTIGGGIAHLITKESKFYKLVIWHLNSPSVIGLVQIKCVGYYACLNEMVEFIKFDWRVLGKQTNLMK